jgi:hypothetical protein
VHFAIAAVVATLAGSCVNYQLALNGCGLEIVLHIALSEPKRAVHGVENVSESECHLGIVRRKL